MFQRKSNNKYSLISDNGAGLQLKVPRFLKSNVYFGVKEEAREKGIEVSGVSRFYKIKDTNVFVKDGFLCEENKDNVIELKANNVCITKENWEEIKKEVDELLSSK